MFKVLFSLLLPVVAWSTNTFDVPGIRVLVVTGLNPFDGQIRMLRTANARNYTVNLLRVEKSNSEVAETLKYLESISNKENEIIFLTPSDTMLMTQQAMLFALKVSQVALLGGGSVVMPYPQRNISSIRTKYDDELLKLEDTLEDDYSFRDNSPRPTTFKEWKDSLRPYAKLKYLQVKVKHEQRKKAFINDSRFCALTGLTIAVKESLRKFLDSPLSNGNGSLISLCRQVSMFGSLRHELEIVYDSNAKIFNFASARPKENVSMSYAAGLEGTITIHSPSYDITPVLIDTHDKMPFDLANMASGEIGLKSEPCLICPDNEIEEFDKHFGSMQNYPIVHFIIAKSVDILGLDEFIENLKNLAYPKTRTMLSFVMSFENGSNYVNDILNEKKDELGEMYLKLTIVSAPGVATLLLFEKIWEIATSDHSDLLFIVDPAVRFSDLDVVEHLLKRNRRMISPLLKLTDDGDYNFVPDRDGNNLAGNSFGGPFIERIETGQFSYKGVLQIPLAFGAVMIRMAVVKSLEMPFKTCFMECEEDNVECHAFNKKRKEEKCKTSYYEGILVNEQSIWGMMFKQIQEQGIIPFICNLHDYGRLLL